MYVRLLAMTMAVLFPFDVIRPIFIHQLQASQVASSIKKEPQVNGSFCKVDKFGSVTAATQADLNKAEVAPSILRMLPKQVANPVIRPEDLFEFTCTNVPGRVVVIPASTKTGQPVSGRFGVSLLNGNASLTFLVSSPEPGTISVRDPNGDGMEIKYDKDGIKEVSAKAPDKSIWSCIVESLRKRADIQDAPGWSLEAALCLGAKSLPTCSVLMAEIAGLLLGVWSDCRT